jgi:NAD(P)-dependent dehydrogenase (short-subunit alcohol dehydrogenase family)
MKFQSKVIVVTGAANGIGKHIAIGFARKGANVVVADIDEYKGEKTVKTIKENDGNAIFVHTDVRNPKQIEQLMQSAVQAFGTIDILINNAGVSRWKPVYELSVEEWDDIVNTNLRSAFFCSKEAAKIMRQNEKGGAIINISSTRALMSEEHSEAYAASKGGLLSLTHALAVSLSEHRIRVNAISPGWIQTSDYESLRPIDHQQHPAGRVGTPEDVLKACLYLADPENDFVTGINLVVDGGMTRKMIYEE